MAAATIHESASKFGPLGLWKDASGDHEHIKEPIEGWRREARRLNGLMNLGAALHNGERGSRADWIAALGDEARLREIDHPKRTVEVLVERLLVEAKVRIRFSWGLDADRGRIRLGGSAVLGTLALHVAAQLSKSQAIFFCSECPANYTPDRARLGDEIHRCSTCRRNKSRIDVRALRADIKDMQQRRAAGESVLALVKRFSHRGIAVLRGALPDEPWDELLPALLDSPIAPFARRLSAHQRKKITPEEAARLRMHSHIVRGKMKEANAAATEADFGWEAGRPEADQRVWVMIQELFKLGFDKEAIALGQAHGIHASAEGDVRQYFAARERAVRARLRKRARENQRTLDAKAAHASATKKGRERSTLPRE